MKSKVHVWLWGLICCGLTLGIALSDHRSAAAQETDAPKKVDVEKKDAEKKDAEKKDAEKKDAEKKEGGQDRPSQDGERKEGERDAREPRVKTAEAAVEVEEERPDRRRNADSERAALQDPENARRMRERFQQYRQLQEEVALLSKRAEELREAGENSEEVEKRLTELREELQNLARETPELRRFAAAGERAGYEGGAPQVRAVQARLREAQHALEKAQADGNEELVAQKKREIEELSRFLETVQLRGRPAPDGQRVELLRAALDNLRQAGLYDQAQQVEAELRRMTDGAGGENRDFNQRPTRVPGFGGPNRGPEAGAAMREEIQQLRQEMEELRQLIRQLSGERSDKKDQDKQKDKESDEAPAEKADKDPGR
jgi:uncharacterized phage infection (PIP) family protein YhgE